VDADVADKLLALNRQFYQTRGEDFSATRMRLQPGVQHLLGTLYESGRVLDLGCGNGELARRLKMHGFSGTYVGLDNSQKLLEIARKRTPESAAIQFLKADIAVPSWDRQVNSEFGGVGSHPSAHFDRILAFSVLHHLPGSELRLRVFRKVRRMVHQDGKFYHSEWQFLNSPRLRARILPWEFIGLTEAQVEAGDYLLDWRRGGFGLRYVHHFSEAELAQLAAKSDFIVSETFYSDGEQGNLGIYQVWSPVLHK
jgi:SAM-dependent methyltransferase